MKQIIILIIALNLLLYSCSDEGQAVHNNDSTILLTMKGKMIKSVLMGKWQITFNGGGCWGEHDRTKDSLYLCFINDSIYENYEKDSLTRRDKYEIKFNKLEYESNSDWHIIFKGIPDLIEDSTSSTSYSVIYDYYEVIYILDDINLKLGRGYYYNNFVRVK